MFNNKQHNLVVTKLFTRGRKLNISLLVIMQYCLQSQKLLVEILHTILL